MKKLLLTILLMLPFSMLAQSENLSTKVFGIELGASKAETLKILKSKGLKVNSIDEGNSDYHIMSYPSKKKISFNGFSWNTVSVRFKGDKTISITFDIDCSSPSATRTQFLNIVKAFSGKYKLEYTDRYDVDMYEAYGDNVKLTISYSEYWQNAYISYRLID